MGVHIYDLLDNIIKMRTTVITTLIGTLVLFIYFLLMTAKFDWNGRNRRFFGLFYNQSRSDTILIAVCIMKFFMVISVFVSVGSLFIGHIIMYGLLIVTFCIFRRRLWDNLVVLFNGSIIMALMYLSSFLVTYTREINFSWKILAVLIFMGAFLLLANLYDLGWCLLHIVTVDDKAKQSFKREKERSKKKRVKMETKDGQN